jgi:hypothetical protein
MIPLPNLSNRRTRRLIVAGGLLLTAIAIGGFEAYRRSLPDHLLTKLKAAIRTDDERELLECCDALTRRQLEGVFSGLRELNRVRSDAVATVRSKLGADASEKLAEELARGVPLAAAEVFGGVAGGDALDWDACTIAIFGDRAELTFPSGVRFTARRETEGWIREWRITELSGANEGAADLEGVLNDVVARLNLERRALQSMLTPIKAGNCPAEEIVVLYRSLLLAEMLKPPADSTSVAPP